MTTDFWTRVLAEYGASDPADFALCCTSATFNDAYNGDDDHRESVYRGAINTLAEQFLANTDAGQRFKRGHVYLFRRQQLPDCSDDEHVAALRAVRRDFLLWARDNDTDKTD